MVSVPEKQKRQLPSFTSRLDPKVMTAFGCIILLLLCGALYSPNFLSPDYLLQQLKVASFLGIIATGMMLVILLGHIDLSVPWVVTSGAMMACAAAALGPWGSAMAIPIGMVFGAMIGFINGWATGYMRIPSMIVTLATNSVAQGFMVVYTGGYAPQDAATPAMRYIATGNRVEDHRQPTVEEASGGPPGQAEHEQRANGDHKGQEHLGERDDEERDAQEDHVPERRDHRRARTRSSRMIPASFNRSSTSWSAALSLKASRIA